MPFLNPLIIGLTLIGAISPLLTFSALFQQKEWRWDRLQEHLRRDGFNQLFGTLRPLVLIVFLIVRLLPFPLTQTAGVILLWQIVFAGLSIVQLAMSKQRMPAWTSKAMILTAIALGITTIVSLISLVMPVLLPILILLQPVSVLIAWLLLKPLDVVLKKRVMDKARFMRSSMKDVTVIGIAGSVGKTTTKELLKHLLQDLQPLTTPAHVNTEMGVAQWLLKNPKTETRKPNLLIVEMGAYRKGEIKLLCDIAQPTIGVMTALGSDHLALFGSEEAIIQANSELIDALPKDGHAFFYGENNGCKQLAKAAACPVTLTSDLKAMNMMETSNGLSFELQATSYKIPLHGEHNLHNALLAISVAQFMNIKGERIAELLKSFKPTAHTFNVTTEQGVTILDDTYNISPLSFKAALNWAATQQKPRTLLTSGLQETGSEEDRFLRELGAQAKDAVERAIFTTSHGSTIFAETFGKPVEVLSASTAKVEAGSTLVCVGRLPPSTINRLLP